MTPVLRKTLRVLAIAFVLAAMFLVTAGPGRGGGGGGHGGGGHAGSAGGYHGGSGGAGSGQPNWWAMGAVVCFVGIVFALVSRVNRLHEQRARLVELVMLLPGDPYLSRLDALLTEGDFTTRQGRDRVLRRLREQVRPGDIIDGFLIVRHQGTDGKEFVGKEYADAARALFCKQMQRAGLREETPAAIRAARSGAEKDSCVLGIITTVGGLTRVSPGGREAASALLRGCEEPYLLYLYLAPDPGRRLSRDEATRLLEALRA